MWRPSCALLLLLGAWSSASETGPRVGEAGAPEASVAPDAGAPDRLRRAAAGPPGPATASAVDPALLLCRSAQQDWRPCALPLLAPLAPDQQVELLDAALFADWARQDKRSLKFNPWGGKREQPSPAKPRPRKAYFSPWGGKRALPFNSWGSKRSADALSAEPFQDDGLLWDEEDVDMKRTGFHSWGGKRAAGLGDAPADDALALALYGEGGEEVGGADKRGAFHSWGGKREAAADGPDALGEGSPADAAPVAPALRLAKRKTKFYPWGGKRSSLDGADRSQEGAVLRRGGADFYPWGGKRSPLPVA